MTRWTRCLAIAGCLIESSRQCNKTYGSRVRPLTPAGGTISSGAAQIPRGEGNVFVIAQRIGRSYVGGSRFQRQCAGGGYKAKRRTEEHEAGGTLCPAISWGLSAERHQVPGWKDDRIRGPAQRTKLTRPPVQSAERGQGGRERNDDHRYHGSEASGRDVPYSGPGRRRPSANGAHVPGFRSAGRDAGQGLSFAQHSGKHRPAIRV